MNETHSSYDEENAENASAGQAADELNLPPAPREALHAKQSQHRKQLGVSFWDLSCYGYTSSERSQSTVFSRILALSRLMIAPFTKRPSKRVQILREFAGLIQSGEMLLVLGRPGSGCSTFLKVLAGECHGIHMSDETRINYQGTSYQEMHRELKGKRIYLAELDVHFAELTLGETLTFAAHARANSASHRQVSHDVSRKVATSFNLNEAFDTKMGNAMIRGVSGGEKRRTSLAEAFISGSELQCWDNSTRGLDSSTAQEFIGLLKASMSSLQSTVVMSIYQASESTYKSFDKVTLLYEGRQIYFGPTKSAVEYFSKLGFLRPSRATTPDFLTSLTNPAERIVKAGYEDRVPRSPDEFAYVWRESEEARQLREDVTVFDSKYPVQQQRDARDGQAAPQAGRHRYRKPPYFIPIRLQILICIQRGFERLRNKYSPVVAGIFGNTVIAIVVGSVFYDIGEGTEGLDKRAVLIFFTLMINAFAPAFEVLSMWAQRPVVEKHDRYAFYYPFTEGLASIICDLPNKIITSVLFSISVYFMTNLRRSAGAFFTYYLFNFVTVLTMSMLFRMIGSLSKTIEQTMAPVAIMVLIFIAYTGFVIPVKYMVSWLEWIRRLNPIAYAYESLMINEFHDRQFPCSSLIPSGPAYGQSGAQGRICATIGAIAGRQDVQGSRYVSLKYGYAQHNLWRNLPIIIIMMAVFCLVHLLAAEYIPAQRAKGEVLLFKRDHFRGVREKEDEERRGSFEFAQDANQTEKGIRKGISPLERGSTDNFQKQSATLHWNNLCYDIKTRNSKRRVLRDVDGFVKPGTLTALMGVTGAGKTTLLDVLADRATTGIADGEVCIDGKLRDKSFQRRMGYVQQEDVHLATATVQESLTFSALLRQPRNIPAREKLEFVRSVVKMLDMESYVDAVVGSLGEGLNVEQRKRLTIAVEMVARPELLLFLDEPTSGLDSQTAWSICMLLRKLKENGLGILCTIHQPSSQLFQLFDRLLLLGRSGETLYFGDIGEDASDVIKYFESNGAPKCQPDENPAEWVLNVTSTRDTTSSEEDPSTAQNSWAHKWNTSSQKQEILRQLTDCNRVVSQTESELLAQHREEYAESFFRQLTIVTRRIFQEYWRDPIYVYSKMALCAGVCLANGLSFYMTKLDIQGLTNILFSIFLLSQLFSTVDQQVIPRIINGRALFEAREKRSKSYSWVVFLASNILVELFWQTLASVLVFVTWYYPTGAWRNGEATFGSVERGALVFGLIWLFCLWITTFSQAIAVGIEHAETAVQIATLFFWLSLVFCGVLVSPSSLPDFWVFVYHASPLTYFISGVILASLANTHVRCSSVETLHIELPPSIGRDGSGTCSDYLAPYMQVAGGYIENPNARSDCLYCPIADTNAFLLENLGVRKEDGWRNFGFMGVYVAFNILVIFGVYWLARVPKRRKSGV